MLNMKETDEDNLSHLDASCMILRKDASRLAIICALMPKNFLQFVARFILAASKHFNLQISSIKVRSVAFRSYYIDHYLQAGVQSPGSLKGLKEVQSAINYLFTKEGIDDCQRAMDFWSGTYMPEDWFLPQITA